MMALLIAIVVLLITWVSADNVQRGIFPTDEQRQDYYDQGLHPPGCSMWWGVIGFIVLVVLLAGGGG